MSSCSMFCQTEYIDVLLSIKKRQKGKFIDWFLVIWLRSYNVTAVHTCSHSRGDPNGSDILISGRFRQF